MSSEPQLSLVAFLSRFARTTSAHGYSRVVAANTWLTRFFWGLLLLFVTSWFFALSYMIVLEFQEQYVPVGFEFTDEEFQYPQLTVCAPFSFSLLKLTRSVKAGNISAYLGEDLIKKLLERRLTSKAVLMSAEETSKDLWLDANDLIVNCAIGGIGKTCNNAKISRLPNDPTCFSISINSTTIQTMNSLGSVSILFLMETISDPLINPDVAKYMCHTRSSAHSGLHLFIHPIKTGPIDFSPDDIILSAGRHHDVSLNRKVTRRVNRFFGTKRCVYSGRSLIHECPGYQDFLYSAAMCRGVELHRHIRLRCNCSISIGCKPEFGMEQSCHFLKSWREYDNNMACLSKEIQRFMFIAPHCLPACDEEGFYKTVRNAPLSDSFALELLQQHLLRMKTTPAERIGGPILHDYVQQLRHLYENSSFWNNEFLPKMIKAVKRNFLTLSLRFDSGSSLLIREKYLISPMTLISNIGGCLGLWVGCSVISIAEFLDLFSDLLYELVRRSCRKLVKTFWRKRTCPN